MPRLSGTASRAVRCRQPSTLPGHGHAVGSLSTGAAPRRGRRPPPARPDRAGEAVAAAPGGEAHARYVCEFGESSGAAVGRPRRARSASGSVVVWSCAFAARGVRSANVGLCVEAQQTTLHAVSTGPPRSASRVAPFAPVRSMRIALVGGGRGRGATVNLWKYTVQVCTTNTVLNFPFPLTHSSKYCPLFCPLFFCGAPPKSRSLHLRLSSRVGAGPLRCDWRDRLGSLSVTLFNSSTRSRRFHRRPVFPRLYSLQ